MYNYFRNIIYAKLFTKLHTRTIAITINCTLLTELYQVLDGERIVTNTPTSWWEACVCYYFLI